MNDDYYQLRAIENLYTAMVADAVRIIEKGKHQRAAVDAAAWLVKTGVPMIRALNLDVDTSTVEPWARRQIALRQVAHSIHRRVEKEADYAIQY